ncbi:pyrroloquinoline quinone biosynthesis peptide chaperone PqqD [Aristophania vespae]|uniref:pyrroloquinoline quinone biosynthesis peptide chaperone PqqD n=1 Tax=Aristophania vespae TaxID=2697033 RepID=UPI0023519243|nr:pyrroloquinoline quinone biosynthesis peptide chaperone PqqD [Aristophania vespae]UMM63983.1 PqqA binding protein [Aristophania vespae]
MLTESCCLKFTRGHRLQHDKVRDLWLIQAPEKAFIADNIAAATLNLIDGERSIADIINQLALEYQAPRGIITKDVLSLLSDLHSKGILSQ